MAAYVAQAEKSASDFCKRRSRINRSLTPLEARLLVDWISSFQSRKFPCPSAKFSSHGFCVLRESAEVQGTETSQGKAGRAFASGASEKISAFISAGCSFENAWANCGDRDSSRVTREWVGSFCGLLGVG